MHFTLPLYVESWKPPNQKVTQHTVRPLFFLEPVHSSERLGKALGKCVTGVQKVLAELGREGKHTEVAR